METQFVPTYASFLIMLQLDHEKRQIKTVLDKTKKAVRFPWGFPGGKEDVQDQNDLVFTAKRETIEETSLVLPEKFQKVCTIEKKNDSGVGTFPNHFFCCILQGKQIPEIKNTKESIVEVGQFTLEEVEAKELKIQHRLALIEFCHMFYDMIKDSGAHSYMRNVHSLKFKRPSLNNWKLRVEPEHLHAMPYLLPKHAYSLDTLGQANVNMSNKKIQ